MFFIIIYLIFCFFNFSEVKAIIIYSNSCSQKDVQSAINLTSSGDIVVVPEGDCTWSTAVTIPSSKKIVLRGSGKSKTIIRGNLYLMQSGSRITGFTFINGTVEVDGDGWRIDHCEFLSDTFREGVHVRGDRENNHPTGLVDNCDFYNQRVLVIGWAGLLSHALWAQPLNLGSGDNVVYVENCTFTSNVHSNAVDANYGGRYVFRFNSVNDTYIEAHSIGGNSRATRKWEIYGNTINQINRSMWAPMFIRGGTGVIFNNTITGTWNSGPSIIFDNRRSFENFDFPPGNCDGTSPWDGNQDSTGWPCRDQIGRSTDQWLWTSDNPSPPQASEPAYIWNNKYQEKEVKVYVHNCSGGSTGQGSCAHIKPGRDYIEGVPKPNYTPYIYPHPLRKYWDDEDIPSPPKNLKIIN